MDIPRSITSDCYNRILIKDTYSVSGTVTYKPATKKDIESKFKCNIKKLPFKYDKSLKSYVSIDPLIDLDKKADYHYSNVAKIKLCLCCGLIKPSKEFTSLYIRSKGKRKTLNTCDDCIKGLEVPNQDQWLEDIRESYYSQCLGD